jgi:hypothetical protein
MIADSKLLIFCGALAFASLVNSKTMIVCEGEESRWHSLFGQLGKTERASKTHSIDNDRLSGFSDCPISNSNFIMCKVVADARQIPGLVKISYNLTLDRVSGLLTERAEFVRTAADAIAENPYLRSIIGNQTAVLEVSEFKGYCKKSSAKF